MRLGTLFLVGRKVNGEIRDGNFGHLRIESVDHCCTERKLTAAKPSVGLVIRTCWSFIC